MRDKQHAQKLRGGDAATFLSMVTTTDSDEDSDKDSALAKLQNAGVVQYRFPGIPNTTHFIQETDQNYGELKSNYRLYLEHFDELRPQAKNKLIVNQTSTVVQVDSDQFRTDVPTALAATKRRKTDPLSNGDSDFVKKAKTAGQHFHTTRG